MTFKRDPAALPGLLLTRTGLLADIAGITGEGAGSIIENPAEVIRDVLARFGGLDAESDMDADAFDAAAAALGRTRFAFALGSVRDLPSLVADLAFQARSVFLWRAGRASMRVLPRGAGGADHDLDAADRAEGSLELGWDDREDLVTAITASFREMGQPREIAVRDAGAIAAWGARTRKCAFWAYGETARVAEAAAFWLERWKSIRRRARLSIFLQGLAIEPGDVVSLTAGELGPDPIPGEVQTVRHSPGSGRDRRMDRIDLDLRLPIWAGCETCCELACESTCMSGCEGVCESGCESACEFSCEASCQNLCEVDCATAAESLCQTACMATSCEVACEVFVTGLAGWDCGACESACQVYCEAVCESVCESLCESTCEVSCESVCESVCESGCETVCEVGCETSCEVGCTTACQLGEEW